MIQYVPPRNLFSIGHFTLYYWGVMFVIAFLVALFLILREAKKQEIDTRHIYNIALIVLLSILVGSRLFYVFEHLHYFILNPLEIINISHGGMASYGGLILALFFGWLYVKKQKDLSFGKTLDLFAPYLALALSIGRIGCFLNGCCYGKPTQFFTKFGINFIFPLSNTALPRHPTQLYLLLANLAIFFIIIGFRNLREKGKKTRFKLLLKKSGSLFLFFLFFYSIFRFSIDFIRVYEHYFLGLAISQWFCLGIFIVAFVSLVFLANKKRLRKNK